MGAINFTKMDKLLTATTESLLYYKKKVDVRVPECRTLQRILENTRLFLLLQHHENVGSWRLEYYSDIIAEEKQTKHFTSLPQWNKKFKHFKTKPDVIKNSPEQSCPICLEKNGVELVTLSTCVHTFCRI